MKRYLDRIVDLALPPRCPLSGVAVDRQGMIAPKVWAALEFIAEPFCRRCSLPFEFDTGTGLHLCGACLEDEPEYTAMRAALRYNDTSRDLILGFKHGDQMHVVLTFLPWLKNAGREFLEQADYLVPVPLHRRRLFSRRYNQAAVIAQRLAGDIGVPALLDGLSRTRHTPSQGHLRSTERMKNVRSAFAVTPRHQEALRGKTIVLIDDVYTTGSTARECTRSLLKAGARDVYVLCIARTVRE